MKKFSFVFYFLFLFFTSGCEKEVKLQERDYSLLISKIEKVDEQGVVLSGSFITEDISKIYKTGFEFWREVGKKVDTIILEGVSVYFTHSINIDLIEGEEYAFRAFALTHKYRIYGNTVSFKSRGFENDPPVIESFSPKKGIQGTIVTVKGSDFSKTKENNKIFIGDVPVNIISCSSNILQFRIPDISTGEYMFTLQVYEKEADFGSFSVMNPKVTDFFPKDGYDSTKVTINGEYFGSSPQVFFGDDQATILEHSSDQIMVFSPFTAVSGMVDLKVISSGMTITSKEKYNILTHSIQSISKNEGKIGDELIIYGSDFIQNNRSSKVIIGNSYAEIKQFSDSEIKVVIPHFEASEPVITVLNGEKTAEYSGFRKIPSWTLLGSFPGSPGEHDFSVSLNSYAYVGLWDGLWRFDPAGNTWTKMKDFPGPEALFYHAFVLNDLIYVIGGYYRNENVSLDLWSYDPATDDWQLRISSFHEDVFSFEATAAELEGYGYLLYNNTFMRYDPGKENWEILTKPDVPEIRKSFLRESDGSLYLFLSWDDDFVYIYEYLPVSRSWVFHRSYFPGSLITYFSHFDLNGKIYFGGGRIGNLLSSRIYEFDPQNLKITKKENFFTGFFGTSCFSINGKAYMGLGRTNEYDYEKFWTFEP